MPAVAFTSVEGTLSAQRLDAVRNGQRDTDLILDQATFDTLRSLSVPLHPQTHVVTADALLPALWENENAWTLFAFDQLTTRVRLLRVDEQLPLDGDLSAYPFKFAATDTIAANYDPGKLTRILMSGTTAIARLTAKAIDQHGIAWATDGLRPYVSRADFFHMSNEVSFDPDCALPEDRRGVPTDIFCAKDTLFPVLTTLGVKIVELSGNHNLDYGTLPYLHSLDLYRAAGIMTLAGGETLAAARQPIQLVHNGNRIALLACNWAGPGFALVTADHPGAAFCDRAWLQTAIPTLAAQNDVVIVSVQYKEFTSFNPLYQQAIDFRELADLGAAVVIGTQAHTPQTFTYHTTLRGESFIHFGLGNLYFDETGFQQRFFMDQLFIYSGRLLTVDLFTGTIEDFGRPRAMTDEERRRFLSVLFNASHLTPKTNQ